MLLLEITWDNPFIWSIKAQETCTLIAPYVFKSWKYGWVALDAVEVLECPAGSLSSSCPPYFVKGLSSVGAEISPREYIRIVRCNMQAKIFIQKKFQEDGLSPLQLLVLSQWTPPIQVLLSLESRGELAKNEYHTWRRALFTLWWHRLDCRIYCLSRINIVL